MILKIQQKDAPTWVRKILSKLNIRPNIGVYIGKINQDKVDSLSKILNEDLSTKLEYWQKRANFVNSNLVKMNEEKPNGALVQIPGNFADYNSRTLYRYYNNQVTSLRSAYGESVLNSSFAEQEAYLGFPHILNPGEMILALNQNYYNKSAELYVHPNDWTPQALPPAPDLTRNEKIVLVSFRYKNTYAGFNDNRFREARRSTGISQQDYNSAFKSLLEKGLIKKAGTGHSRTIEGDNAVSKYMDFYSLKQEQET